MSYERAFSRVDQYPEQQRLHASLMTWKMDSFYFIAEKFAQFKYFTYLCIS